MTNNTSDLGWGFSANPGVQSTGFWLIALMIAVVFVIDCFTPLGFGVSFVYVLLLWIALGYATARQTLVLAAASFVLTVISFFLSPEGDLRMDLVNRTITLFSLLVLAYFSMVYRKAMDTVLRQERELTDFVENAPIGIQWVDSNGTILWVNQEELDMLGYSRVEYVGHCVVDFHVDREVAKDILEKLNAKVPLKDCMARLQHKDGSIRNVLISCNVFWKDGRFIHGRCFTQDITDRVRAGLVESERAQLAVANARLVEETAERRKMELDLREREEFLRATFDSAPVGISLADLDGHFVKANAAYQRMVGYSEAELLHMSVYRLSHPDHAHQHRTLRQELIAGKREFYEIEKRNCSKDGRIVWVHSKGSLIKDALGNPRYTIVVSQDITKRKEAEETLLRSQKMYVGLVNSIEGIVWEADARTLCFSFVSRQAERLLGYPVERWLGGSTFWRDHIHPDDRKWAVDFYVTATREKRAHDFEYRMLTADGRTVWVRDIVSVSVENDQPVRLHGIIVDITERKLTRQALEESEERFALFMHHLPNAAAFIKDVEGRYVYANPVSERAMRTQPGGWRGRTDDDLYPPAVAQQRKASDHLVISDWRAIETIETFCRDDGIQHSLVRKFPIPGNTNSSPLLGGIAIDITTIKRTEEALVTSERQSHQLLIARERLFRDLHDHIIQAIYAIGMQLEACQRLLRDDRRDTATQLAQIIRGLNDVIRDVRRYIAGFEPQIPGGPRLHAELAKLVKTIGATGALRFRLNVDPLAVARLTPQQAEHVLHIAREALSNGLRHSHAKQAGLSLQGADTGVRLEISDDGAGFDPEAARQNGDGLSNMEFRTQQIGGRLEILSSPGHGVKITLHIPKEQAAHDIR